jgi:hypothetical protein
MTSTDPKTINRRGCFILAAFLLLIVLLAGWMATRTPDGAAADELLSRSAVQ